MNKIGNDIVLTSGEAGWIPLPFSTHRDLFFVGAQG